MSFQHADWDWDWGGFVSMAREPYVGPLDCPDCQFPVCAMPPDYWRCVFCGSTSSGRKIPKQFVRGMPAELDEFGEPDET